MHEGKKTNENIRRQKIPRRKSARRKIAGRNSAAEKMLDEKMPDEKLSWQVRCHGEKLSGLFINKYLFGLNQAALELWKLKSALSSDILLLKLSEFEFN